MCRNAVAEESVRSPLAGVVVKLRRKEDIARSILFLEAAHRSDANDPTNVQRAEGVDVRTVIQFMRKQPMAPTVARKEKNLPAMHLSSNNSVGWFAERRRDALFGRIFHPLHLIKTAAPDDADGWCV